MTDIEAMEPHEVTSRDDLVRFLGRLAREAATEEVENPTTSRYLEAASAWAQDCDGAYAHAGQSVPELTPEGWEFVARLFEAALVYE